VTFVMAPRGGTPTTAGSLAVRAVASISRPTGDPGRINAAPPNRRVLDPAHAGQAALAGTSAIANVRSKLPQLRQVNS
jgi:hypothetical protein